MLGKLITRGVQSFHQIQFYPCYHSEPAGPGPPLRPLPDPLVRHPLDPEHRGTRPVQPPGVPDQSEASVMSVDQSEAGIPGPLRVQAVPEHHTPHLRPRRYADIWKGSEAT